MRIHVVDHPLVAHKLTVLRDQKTDSGSVNGLQKGKSLVTWN